MREADPLLRRPVEDSSAPPEKAPVEYDGDNHAAVLFQMYGSVWGKVFPWCLATTGFTSLVILLRSENIVDLTVRNSTGHSFMSLLVSFLLVTRATITYNRFMEARQHLSDLYRSSREIVQYTCILTLNNTNAEAIAWRQEVAYRTIVCLRMAQAAVEYRSSGVTSWDTLSNHDQSQTELLLDMSFSHHGDNPLDDSNKSLDKEDVAAELHSMAHGPRTSADENFRAPIVWAYNLRKQVLATRHDGGRILPTRPMHVNEELKILACVADFVTAFHGHRKLITTPFPFPMVQMARTFLFFWVFSLPLVLVAVSDDDASTNSYSIHDTVEVLLIMFFCTYGFLGLEYVSVELDDPYGDDPNDFPGQRWSEIVFEDVYISIYQTDGYGSAMELRERVTQNMAKGAALDLFQSNQVGWESIRVVRS